MHILVLVLLSALFAQVLLSAALPAQAAPPAPAKRTPNLQDLRDTLRRRTAQHLALNRRQETFPCVEWAVNAPCAQFDAVVVGGGFSGLQAAMSLGRLGRNVLVLDSQEYRNAATLAAHDVIVLDGMPPSEIRALARGNLTAYPTVHYEVANVTAINSVDNGTFFEVNSTVGNYTSRKVVLATGVTDVLPAIPGIGQIWGTGGFWCPWCDGFEHRDGHLAVLDMSNAGEALALQKLNPNTTIYTNGLARNAVQVTSPAHVDALLAAKNIPVVTDNITSVALSDPNDRRSAVVMNFLGPNNMSSTIEVKGFMFTTTRPFRSEFLIHNLGLNVSTLGGNAIWRTDYTGQTSNFGVWAVGDAASTAKNIANAIFSGKSAAVPIVFRLAYEESRAAAGLDWRY